MVRPAAVFCGELKSRSLKMFFEKNFDLYEFNSNAEFYSSKKVEIEKVELIVLTVDSVFTYKMASKFKSLKLIFSLTSSLNHIEINAVKSLKLQKKLFYLRDIWDKMNEVTGAADLALTLVLAASRKVFIANKKLDDGATLQRDSSLMGHEFGSLKIGIIGYGRIGRILDGYLNHLGISTYVYDPISRAETPDKNMGSISKLIESCHGLVMCASWQHGQEKIIDKQLLKEINSPDFFLVNIARGELVCERSIIESLLENRMHSYITDVCSSTFWETIEKRKFSSALNFLKNSGRFEILPHIGGFTYESTIKTQNFLFEFLISRDEK